MSTPKLLFIAAISSMIAFVAIMIRDFGIRRGLSIAFARALWVSPILLGLFPQKVHNLISNFLNVTPIHVLIDDSKSMQKVAKNGVKSQDLLKIMKDECEVVGCKIQVTTLSQEKTEVRDGYTPIKSLLQSWFKKIDTMPWVVYTDGGDSFQICPGHCQARERIRKRAKNLDLL